MAPSRISGIESSLLKVPQYCCEFKGCRKFFSKLSRLKYHENTHLKEKPYKCDYEGCSSAYGRPAHLKRHVEISHKLPSKSPRNFMCSEDGCEAAFENERSLYFHSKRKHSPQPLECSYCDKKFSKKWMFKEHEAGHTGAFPFRCDVESCNQEFKGYNTFKRIATRGLKLKSLAAKAHKRDHSKKAGGHSCPAEECNLVFTKWSDLVNHKKLSHPEETQCSICNKTFTKGNLKVHQQIHNEDRVTLQCPVDGCPRFYYQKKNLTHHIKTKHEGHGYECNTCGRKLSTKQKLDQHVRIIHTDKSHRRKKKPKTKNILDKLTPMSEKDWDLKKTGPPRFIRQKYDYIKFPSESTDKADTNKV